MVDAKFSDVSLQDTEETEADCSGAVYSLQPPDAGRGRKGAL